MAGTSFLYGAASQQFATAQWNWPGLVVWGMLVNSTYVPQQNSDVYVSAIPPGAILARTGPMTTQAAVNGICSGALPQIDSLLSTTPAAAVILYVNSGSDSTSQLIYYSSGGIGFPLPLQGFNYGVVNDQAHSGWFQV